MKLTRYFGIAVIAAGCWILTAAPAAAQQMKDVMNKLESLSQTVQQQQEMLMKQAAEIERLRGELAGQKQTTQKNEEKLAKVEEKADSWKVPDLKSVLGDKFSFSTDLRLRYEGLYDRQQGKTTLDDRNRFRIRWRVFGDYKLNEELAFHSMLTTSSGSWFEDGKDSHNWQPGRTSNQTMDDEFNNKDVFIGRIYATYDPNWAPGLQVAAGKFKNEFLHTDIMWDPDVNPEGAWERYQLKVWDVFQPFVHFGQMAVSENNKTDDAYLLLWQAGAVMNLPAGFKWTVAGSYYGWDNLDQSNMSQIEYTSAGNSVGADGNYLYEYKLVEGITFLDFKVANIPVMLWFDYIENTADDVPDGYDTAWSTGIQLGKAKKQGDHQIYFKYAYIEPDAVVGAVADGDFYGSNREGYKVQYSYQVYNPLQFRMSWFQTDVVEGTENSESRLQADFVLKFKL